MSNAILILQSEAKSNDIKLDSKGRSIFSVRATARLVKVDEKAIRAMLESAELKPSKLAETLAEQGFEGAELEQWKTNGIPDIAVYHIVYYYAHDAGRYCTEQAKLMAKAFGAMGVRAFSQKALGYTDRSEAIVSRSPAEI
ncbi:MULTISPECIES: hypothetical protein [unclassified Nostoc]|uniref:hypothetical protein n=1 Tax=unclassified Nostoc TaxID=2593658 RepID=UPI002AD4B031|nr:hypothetical protein [Nostoc sp. DedQUE03]MDZ7977556.1 hypothetical protein [Nostoc sp. DedQUE03]MDZ8049328.1 hypothetical protein [Nostoc sp. DedQUE02]